MPFLWEDEGLLDILEYRLGPLLRPFAFVGRKLRCWARGHDPTPIAQRALPRRYGERPRYRYVCLRCGATRKPKVV